jgi:membrane protein
VTALLWSAMRPAFVLFLVFNHSYGTIFGGMKNLFLSIGWLYYGFVVFLIGTEIIAALHKRDVLMLRGLFLETPPDPDRYHSKLMTLFGRIYQKDGVIFREGEEGHDLFYVLEGSVAIKHGNSTLRSIGPGGYFGEMAFLTNAMRTADAMVESDSAKIVVISPENLETLLLEEPKVALGFLKEMALRLKEINLRQAH